MKTTPPISSRLYVSETKAPPDQLHFKTESLPFSVRLVKTAAEQAKAIQIRHAAYMRHVPRFAAALRTPEALDSARGVAVLLAESKLNASPIGSMRIQLNEFAPLTLECAVDLLYWLRCRRLAEATRLGVTHERVGRIVTLALFKAYYLYCKRQRVEWMVIAARSPVDRSYDRLLFRDVVPGMGYVPFAHLGNIPHRVMAFEVQKARELWLKAKHPLFDFMAQTRHEDIDIGAGV